MASNLAMASTLEAMEQIVKQYVNLVFFLILPPGTYSLNHSAPSRSSDSPGLGVLVIRRPS